MSKFFTVVVPVYNPTRLERALDSIESQRNKENIEVIIVDDNSTNKEYQKLLSKYTFDYKLIENNENLGPGLARQVGMDAAAGEWITFLDHDDEFNPDCFEYIEKFIVNSGCEFVLSSNTLIANDYDWSTTELYQVEASDNFLHGKFYNIEKLKYYNVHFSKDLRAQEDTFFISLIEGYLLLDRENFNLEKAKIMCPLITYYWYLWPDSTSHSVSNDERKLSYLEDTFDEYIIANFTAYKTCSLQFPQDELFKYSRCISLLVYCYWFYESFLYSRPETFKKENLDYVKNLVNLVMKELGLTTRKELVDIISDAPIIYETTFKAILENVEMPFVPIHGIREFFALI